MTSTHPKRGFVTEFILAGSSSSMACVFSNPMEVVKTRLQLQGELARSAKAIDGAPPAVQYRNFAHAFYTICRMEGLRGIQRGLMPGITYQVFMNAPRLGLFGPLQRGFGATDPTDFTYPLRNMAAASTSGMIGAFCGSPFFLVKARIQAASTEATVNSQYKYKNMFDGFRQIMKSEGIFGLYRGVSGSLTRVAVGSTVQLTTYSQAKALVLAAGIEDGFNVHLGSSMVTGLIVTTMMNPFDVVSTRLYSQRVIDGKGELYDGLYDCLKKTFKSEGLKGFYKGWAAHYLRLGPHTVFTFVIWEQVKQLAAHYGY